MTMTMNMHIARTLVLSSIVAAAGCDCGGVNSEESARIAYLGMDTVIVRSLAMGFDGFGAGDSANIPEQTADADESGTIVVNGQVDQGNSDNKGFRLDVALTEFSEGPIDDPETDEVEEFAILYSTAEGAPIDCDMQLRDFPDGTLENGTFVGTVQMTGDIEGEVDVSLTFSGLTDPDENNNTVREVGSTTVTGTATSGAGTFDIDTTI